MVGAWGPGSPASPKSGPDGRDSARRAGSSAAPETCLNVSHILPV